MNIRLPLVLRCMLYLVLSFVSDCCVSVLSVMYLSDADVLFVRQV